ncbi:hypothetical protein MTO96_024701 [Rhipicephalus appendiculatus]
MRAPRVCLLLLVVLLSANFIEALSYQLEQPREFQDDPDDTDLDDGGDEPFEESDDEATEEEGPSEEDGDQEDEDEEDGTYEEEIESRTGRKSRGRVQGLSGHSGQMMLGEQRRVIHEIEIVIDLGRKFEKNLDHHARVHTRNDQTEARFRTLLKRILSGEIRSKQRSRVLLQGLLTGYRTSLHSLFRNSSGFLRSIVQGVSGALSHLGMGILDIFRLKFQPFKFAINAITNGGSFRRPISSVLFGR